MTTKEKYNDLLATIDTVAENIATQWRIDTNNGTSQIPRLKRYWAGEGKEDEFLIAWGRYKALDNLLDMINHY